MHQSIRRPQGGRMPFYFKKNTKHSISHHKARGEYQRSVEMLYVVAYTLKMSRKGDHHMDGYFDYVVSWLEGLWYQEGV